MLSFQNMFKNTLLKRIIRILLIIGILLPMHSTFADCSGWFSFGTCEVRPPICNDGSCTLSNGVTVVGKSVDGLITNRPLSTYAQDIVVYLLGFISLIAVIYIMYAGFQVITGAGDEEKNKKAKHIITYVIIGLGIIWVAYSIVAWTIWFLPGKKSTTITTPSTITTP